MSLVESYNKANIFLGLIEDELNSLRGADYISVHIRFDLERYLLIIIWRITETKASGRLIILHQGSLKFIIMCLGELSWDLLLVLFSET